MKINADCVRDILLTVEENTANGRPILFSKESMNYPLLANYNYDEVIYHIQQCKMEGFFSTVKIYTVNSYNISGLSPTGHKFLADIQEDTTWNKFKSLVQKSGDFATDTLKQILAEALKNLITG